MKNIYLVLAIVGAVVPYVFFLQFFADEGMALSVFVGGLFANGASSGFVADLLITSGAFWLFLIAEREPRAWIYVVVNLTIGLSCALPLYLYVRARRLESGGVVATA